MPLFPEWKDEVRGLSARRFEDQRREWVRGTTSPDVADRLTRSLALYDADPATHLSLAQAGVDPERDAGVWARFQAASQVYSSSRGALVGNRGPASSLVDQGGPRPVYRSTGAGAEELVGFTGVEPGDGQRLARIIATLVESQPTGHGARDAATFTGHGARGQVRQGSQFMTERSLVRAIEEGYVDVADLLELDAQLLQAQGEALTPQEKQGGGGLFGAVTGFVGDVAGGVADAGRGLLGLSSGTGPATAGSPLVASGGGSSQGNPLAAAMVGEVGQRITDGLGAARRAFQGAMSATPIDDYLEPIVNVGVQVLDTPYQLTQAAARSAYRDWNADGFGMFVPDSFDLEGLQEFTTLRAVDIGLQTSVGTMAADIGEEFNRGMNVPRTIGARPGLGIGEGVNIGEGFFYSGPGEDVRDSYARGVAEIDGHTFTIGRYLASPFDAGSKPNAILSGLIDAGLALAGPGDLALDSTFNALAARRAFRTTEGGVPAIRLGDAFVSADNADDVTALLRGAGAEFSDEDVARLVSARTPEAVTDALAGGIPDGAASVLHGWMADQAEYVRDAVNRFIATDGASAGTLAPEEVRGFAQEFTASAQRNEVPLFRGTSSEEVGYDVLSSWTTDEAVAREFADALEDGVVLRAEPGEVVGLSANNYRGAVEGEYAARVEAGTAFFDTTADDLWQQGEVIGVRSIPWGKGPVESFLTGQRVPLRGLGLNYDAQLPQGALEALRSRWGAIRGIRPTVDPRAVEAYLDSRKGSRAIQLLADTDSTHRIDQITRGTLDPGRLARYADETDPAVLRAMLAEDLGLNVTGGLRGRRPAVIDAVRDMAPRVSRLGHAVPSGSFDLDNGRRLLDQLGEWAANTGANTATVSRWHDRMSRAASRSERFNVLNDFFVETALRTQVRTLGGHGSGVDDIVPEIARRLEGTGADPEDVLGRLLRHEAPMTGDDVLDAQLVRMRNRTEQMWRLFSEDQNYARVYAAAYNADTLEEAARGLPVRIGDETVEMSPESVHLHNETINRHVPMPDARQMRRYFSNYRGILLSGDDLRISTKVHNWLLGVQSGLWKPAVLFRAAWPVRVVGEEQLRLAAGGYTSLAWHPLQHISAVIGGIGGDGTLARTLSRLGDDSVDLLGRRFQLSDEWAAAMSSRVRGGTHGRARRLYDTRLDVDEARARELWADEMGKITHDSVGGMVLRAESLDEAKETFWNNMRQVRSDLAASGRTSSRGAPMFDVTTRVGADAYIESVYRRIEEVAGNNPEVIDAMRTRRIGEATMGRGDQLNPDFVNALESYADSMPRFLPGWVPDVGGGRFSAIKEGERLGEEAVERMFGVLMGVPTNNLSRSPVFRQAYWDEVVAIAPRVDRAARDTILENARAAGLDRGTVDQLNRTIGTQIGPNDIPLSAEEADLLAKGVGLDTTQELLFDVSKRNQFFDSLSIVFPFGDAWAEVLTRWARLVREDPQVVRRAEQVIEAGRDTGIIYENDRGEEVFAYPLSGTFMESMSLMPGVGTAAPIPLTGRLNGLSLATEMYPGIGPVMSIPVAAALPDSRNWDWLRDTLFPYGEPNVGGNPFETAYEELVPVHWRRVATGLSQDAMTDEEQRQYATSFGQVLALLGDTGEYDVFSTDSRTARAEWTRLIDDAHEANGALWFGRGLAVIGAGAPSSPSPEFYFKDTSGNAVHISAVRELYQKVWEENPDDPLGAFLAEYDVWALAGVQGKTISQYFGGGVPPTAAAEEWVRDNPDFVDSFELVAGYFAPQGGDIDFNAWNRQLDDGDRIPLTEDQMVSRYLHTLGTYEYNKARDAIVEEWEEAGWDMSGTYPVQIRRYLEDLDNDLVSMYGSVIPSGGYQGRSSRWNGPSSSDDSVARDMLRDAIEAPEVADTDIAGAIRTYFETIDSTDELYREHYPEGTTNWYSSTDGQRYRQYVVEVADWLIQETPEFRVVWEEAFEPLIREGLEKDLESEEE